MAAARRMKPNLKLALAPARRAGASLFFLCILLTGFSLSCNAPPAADLTATARPGSQITPSPASPLLATPALSPSATLFRLASPSPTASPTPADRPPSATPACQDGLRYLADVTVPDGTIVAPGESIDKQWQVENSGSCNWNEDYRLRRISGPSLDAPDEQALYPARSGTQAVIGLLLVAPNEPGTYRSAWQAYTPQGTPFGDPIYVEILVSSGSP